MKIALAVILALALLLTACSKVNLTGDSVALNEKVTFYKSGSCGCCSVYLNYLQSKTNLAPDVVNLEDLSPIKKSLGVPANMESCHTLKIGDYFIEGHMPVEAISKLLAEKPDIKGIALAGMPSGAPGMPGGKLEQFVIYAVHKDGTQDVFMTI